MSLPFIVIDLVELFPDLPEGGSIDDVPDIREAMQVIADALPSQLPAQVDYDDEPEPVDTSDPVESTPQADLLQDKGRDAFTFKRLVPEPLSSSANR